MEWRPAAGTGTRKRKNITRDHCFTRLQVHSSSADPRFLRKLEANALRTMSVQTKAQAGPGFGKMNRFNASGAVSRSWSKLQMLTRTLKRDTSLLLGQDENENAGSHAESSREKMLEEMEARIESEENPVNMKASSKVAENRFRTSLDICTCNKRLGNLCSCSALPSPIANASKVTTTNRSLMTQQPAREEPGLTTDKFADFPERAKEKRFFRWNIQEALERDKLALEEFLAKQRQGHASREGPAEVDHNYLEFFPHRNLMQSATFNMSDEAGRTENCPSLSFGRPELEDPSEQTPFEKDSGSIFQECTGRLSMDTAKLHGTINKLLDKNKQLQDILCGRKNFHDQFTKVEVGNRSPFQLSTLSASSKSTVIPHSTESQCPHSERTSTTEGVELMTEVEACTTLYLGYRHTDDCGDFPHGYSYLYVSPAFEVENMDPNTQTSCKCCSKPKAQFKRFLAPACCDSWTQTSDRIVASVSTEFIPSTQTGSCPLDSEDGHCPPDDGHCPPYHVNIPHVRMSTGTRQEAGGEHYVQYNANLEHLGACPRQSISQTAEKPEEESVAGLSQIISAQKGEAFDVPKSNERNLKRSLDAQVDALHEKFPDFSLRCQDSVRVPEKQAKDQVKQPSDDDTEKLKVTESLLKQTEEEAESLQNEINKIKSELAQSLDKIGILEQALVTKELNMEQITHSRDEARVHALQVERSFNAKVEEVKHVERNKCSEQFQSSFEIIRRELFSSLESIVSLKHVVGEKEQVILDLETKIKAMEAANDSRQAVWEEKVAAGERTIAHVNSLLASNQQHNRMLEERLAKKNVQVERMESRLQEMENAEAVSKKCQAILVLQLEEAKRNAVEMAQALESENRSGLSALASNNAKSEFTEASKAVVEVHADMLTGKKPDLSSVVEEEATRPPLAEKETTRKPQAKRMQHDLVSIELENFRLKGHIKESERQLEDQKRQLIELMSINEDLLEFAQAKENELVCSHTKISDLQQILHDKAEENTVLMQQIEGRQNQTQAAFMKSRYQTPKQKVADTDYEVNRRAEVIEPLMTKRLAAADADYEVNYRAEVIERLTKRLAAALVTEDALRKEAGQLHVLLKTSQFKEHEVNEQVSRLRRDKQDLEGTVRSLERKIMLFRAEVDERKAQNTSLRKIVEDKDWELRVLHKDVEQLRAREQILEEDVLEKEGQIAILKESFADDDVPWLN